MKRKLTIGLFFLLQEMVFFAQTPTCPSPYVYMDGGAFIKYYDPGLPLTATNPNTLNIPTFGSGLTLMPNINGGTLTPTFYTTSGGNYWYWNGVTWINTGHSTGNASAVNLAGCAGALYNIVGGTGQIYSYNGTGTGTLLTTISGFNGGGPYDLVTDCNCNFYVLKTTTPNQNLTMYSPSGSTMCSYSLTGLPSASAGGGFAIVGNTLYLKNNGSPGFYIGNISGSNITFTAVNGFNSSPGDFASCPVCYAPLSLSGVSISGGLLGCTIPTAGLVVTTTASPVSYAWSGPGILGATNGSVIAANVPGVYTCSLSAGGCPPSQITLTTSVLTNSTVVMASITPSGNICLPANGSVQLVVAHSATSDVVVWSGPGLTPFPGPDTLIVGFSGTYSVQVTDIFNGCVGIDMVNVANSPSVSLALSDNSLCAQNTNGSPASITITPFGASNYTFLTSTNFSTTSPNGPLIPCYYVNFTGNTSPLATGTLIGRTSFCTDTAVTSFSIVPNPSISISSTLGSVCPGGSQAFSVSGAINYVWTGSPGLNTYVGSNVISSPSANSVYSVMGSSDGCNSSFQTATVIILPIPAVSIAPQSSTICLGSTITLTVLGNATSFFWSPSVGLSSTTGQSVTASPPGTQVYTVVGDLNSCQNTATAMVTIVQPPVLSLALSNSSLCSQNYNGSPNSISFAPTGAASYTLLGGSNVMIANANGPVMGLIPIGPSPPAPTVLTTTLIGRSSVCTVQLTQSVTLVPNPILTIVPTNTSICPGASQLFVASGATTYSWLPALNYSLAASNAIVANPSITSFYSVFGSSAGCKSDTKNAVLVVLPVPSVSITPKTSTVCAGSAVNLVAEGNAATYSWWPLTALSAINGATVTSSPFTTQTYTVVGTLNTCSNMAVATVSAIQIPVITASANNHTVCRGATTILEVQGASSYLWFPSSYLNQASGNAVISAPNQNMTYTVKGYNGICTGSTTIDIVTVKLPEMTILASENQICKGSSLPITVRGAQSYTWIPKSGLYFNGSDTSVIAAPLTTTNYTVVGSNSLGTVSCLQQLSYSVIVVPLVVPKISGNQQICVGDKITLYASGGNTFSWSPSAGLNVTDGSGVVASPKISTIYTVHVSQNTFCGTNGTVQVDVYDRPSVFAGRDTVFNLNESIFVKAIGTGTLMWVAGEGILCRDCPETQVYPSRSGCYLVRAVNEFGCTATDDICIQVTEDFTFYIPNTFSPNNDGLNDVFLIFGENISSVSMEIYDRWGTRVFQSNDVKIGWDGRYKGEGCKVDVYTYVISYKGLNRKLYSRTGNVNLVK
ncbi:MAG: gliding motility-associated C-terminal domain-containing protein [bacterium]|nr:gliding motility-associated C-terminal domain-containing protein [bacterium]